MTSTAVPQQPYPGLRPFDEGDHAIFFGREAHIVSVLALLEEQPFVAIVGSSGSGKSSLIRAGVIPAVREGFLRGTLDWKIIVMKPGSDPMGNLARALMAGGVLKTQAVSAREEAETALAPAQATSPVDMLVERLQAADRSLIDLMSARGTAPELELASTSVKTFQEASLSSSETMVAEEDSAGPPVLLVVDQFEELFTFRRVESNPNLRADVFASRDDAAGFVRLLLRSCSEPGGRISVVITMRSDFIGDCDAFLDLPEEVSRCQFLVPRLNGSQMKEAIERPGQIDDLGFAPFAFEDGLVRCIIAEAGDHLDQLPLMQHALMRTWKFGGGPTAQFGSALTLTHRDYRSAGGIAEALSKHADAAWTSIEQDEARANLARRLFLLLSDVHPDGKIIRRRPLVSEVQAVTGANIPAIEEIVRLFQSDDRNFLLPPLKPGEHLSEADHLDLCHEALLRQWVRLGDWLKEESKSAETYVGLAKRATIWKTEGGELLAGGDLVLALKWQQNQNPTAPWAERYYPGYANAIEFLAQSQKAEDEKNLLAWTNRRNTGIAVALTCVALAILAGWAWHEKNLAKASEEKIKLRAWANLEKEKISESRVEALVLAIQAAGEVEDSKDKKLQDDLPQVQASLLNAIQAAQWSLLIQAHQGAILSVAFSPDGKTIVSGGDDGTVRSWELATGKPIGEPLPRPEDSGAYRAAISDGKTIVSVGKDETVRLWDLTGKPIGEPLQGNEGVASVAISTDKTKVVSGDGDGTVRLWDLATGELIGEPWQGHSNTALVDISPDGKTIVSSGEDETLRLWDPTGKPIGEPLQGHRGMVSNVAFSPDGKTIVSGGDDGTVRLWDLATAEPIGEPVMGSHGPITSVAISPNATKIVCGNSDGALCVWNRKDFLSETKLTSIGNRKVEDFSSIAVTPDGKTIVSGGDDGTLRLWDRETGKPLGRPMEGHLSSISCLAISRDGKTIVSGGDDGTLRLWDRETEKLLGKPMEENESVKSLAISPDGKTVVSGDDEGTMRLWDWETGKSMGEPMKEHEGSVSCLAISRDGKTIVSGGADGTVRLWDRETEKPLGKPLRNPKKANKNTSVDCLTISPDGKTIVSGSADKKIRLWTFNDKQEWEAKVLKSGKVTSVSFHPKGLFFASGSDDGAVQLWDLHGELFGRQVVGGTGGVSHPVTSVFSDDSKAYDIVAIEANTKTARLWRIPDPATWLRTACERVRNHDVLVDPRNELAREIGEEFGDKALVKNAVSRCMKYGEWSPVEKADLVIRRGRPTADEGVELAGQGEIEGAIADFKEAQKFDPEVDLDPATPATDKDPQAVARRLAAHAKVEKGVELAWQGEIEGAIADFKEAQKLDPEVDLDPATPAVDKDFQAIVWHLAAPAKVVEGAELAGQGDIDGAIAAFKEAQKLDPKVDLDPATSAIDKDFQAVARHLATSAKVEEGAVLAGQGDIDGAIAAFKEAQKLDPEVDLVPATQAIDKDPQSVAGHLAESAIKRIGFVQLFDGGTCWESGLSIDVDGAIHAYHPDQKSGLDNLLNAGQPGHWFALVTDNGEPSGNPIIQTSSDPAPGFYVTYTMLQDRTKEAKDPHRYVDSESIPFISVPGRVLRTTKAKLGDFAAVFNTENQKLSYAIVADLGPSNRIGEGSIALAIALGIAPSPKNGGSDHRVFIYKIFPGSGNETPRSREEIESEGARLLKDWGGKERLLSFFSVTQPL